MLADTLEPPYYAVIFSSIRTAVEEGYNETASRMVELAKEQPGFLGVESARDDIGITVSYWATEAALRAWHEQVEHQEAQRNGYRRWYQSFRLRVAKVERAYGFERPASSRAPAE
ncbi:MAG TPA: antibiotic biosynthesis monooxygenase [Bryobacteraceae bacterium]|nr:antibiotic biosynthesis monooxygenase [Bryobacteraceae bacterium]